ncbi:MAG TPA: hypothetical protein VGP07_17490 [Polyangia bacterium]|jgi:hypothetical protein
MRAKFLIIGLVAVLVLVVFAFWRAVAGPGAPRRAGGDDSTPASVATTGATTTQAVNGAAPPVVALPPPPPPSVPPAPPAASAAAAAAADAAPPIGPPGPLDEAHLMARLRAIKDKDPAGAVQLAREGNKRFTDSRDAPERTSILIHALVAVDKGSEARGEAEEMVNHYPDSTWVREVEMFTGAHRHRNIRVNDAGQIVTE